MEGLREAPLDSATARRGPVRVGAHLLHRPGSGSSRTPGRGAGTLRKLGKAAGSLPTDREKRRTTTSRERAPWRKVTRARPTTLSISRSGTRWLRPTSEADIRRVLSGSSSAPPKARSSTSGGPSSTPGASTSSAASTRTRAPSTRRSSTIGASSSTGSKATWIETACGRPG